MSDDAINIWQFNSSNKPTYADLDRIGNVLMKSLSAFIGQSTRIVEQHLVLNDGLAFSFRRERSDEGLLDCYWEGKLLYSVRSDVPAISAEFFLFIDGHRIGRIVHRGSSILQFSGQYQEDGGVHWLLQGLLSDEFEEWAYIKEPQWKTQTDVRRTLD
jgi:hypothetical protein